MDINLPAEQRVQEHDAELRQMVDLQKQILEELDDLRYGDADEEQTFGERLADQVVDFIGSWRFLVSQSTILLIWIILNVWVLPQQFRWDKYPLQCLNLLLSLQAAFATPLVLLASNRMAVRDRRRAQESYRSIERVEGILRSLSEKIKLQKNGNGTVK